MTLLNTLRTQAAYTMVARIVTVWPAPVRAGLAKSSVFSAQKAQRMAILLMCCFLPSCAYLGGADKVEVYLTGLRPLSSSGLEARFMVGLKIVNTHDKALNISGMSYRLRLNGHSVASGVAGGMSSIPAYSERRVEVEASTNLLASFSMISEMLRNPAQSFNYELETKLRMSWWPIPVTVIESGDINLGK